MKIIYLIVRLFLRDLKYHSCTKYIYLTWGRTFIRRVMDILKYFSSMWSWNTLSNSMKCLLMFWLKSQFLWEIFSVSNNISSCLWTWYATQFICDVMFDTFLHVSLGPFILGVFLGISFCLFIFQIWSIFVHEFIFYIWLLLKYIKLLVKKYIYLARLFLPYWISH